MKKFKFLNRYFHLAISHHISLFLLSFHDLYFLTERSCERQSHQKALTITGSGCCGEAGIQANLKTFAGHGVYGLSVITAVTAQNTQCVMEMFHRKRRWSLAPFLLYLQKREHITSGNKGLSYIISNC